MRKISSRLWNKEIAKFWKSKCTYIQNSVAWYDTEVEQANTWRNGASGGMGIRRRRRSRR